MSNTRIFFGLAASLALLPQSALASWWNDEWAGRKPLRVDASPTGANIAEPIGATPILVRLSSGTFNFSAAKPDGSDLRFIAGDDRTPLKFHFEKYDSLLGEALVWVGLPELTRGAKSDLWLYYGNPKAAGAEDVKGTYDVGTSLIYHFEERGQPPKDSTTWGNHALNAGAGTDALIGSGLKLDGSRVVGVPAAAPLAWAAGTAMTWSAWIKPAEATSSGVIFSRRDGANALVIGLDNGKPFVEIERDAGALRADASEPFGSNGWHFLAVTAGQTLTLWVDGAVAAKLPAPLPSLNTAAFIGGSGEEPAKAPGDSAAAPLLAGFKGELDELEISKVERPAGFLRIAFVAQGTDAGKLVVAGQDEEASTGSGGYFGVILRSVTIDGWVVIGLLAIMGVISWLVMINKTTYLAQVERANDLFSEKFHHASGDLLGLMSASNGVSLQLDAKTSQHSSLFRIFKTASEEVRKRIGAGRALTAEAIEAIRASMDSCLVRENQRLTDRLVLLTIAISGGPFLGLLGTVVGVMITFAAIAAAGDVNVNAIAPGIAAALVATVAGLAVAIPALFGYNWLLTRIKNVTANMQVFVDELVTKVAEAHAESSGREPGAAPHSGHSVFETTPPLAPTAAFLQD